MNMDIKSNVQESFFVFHLLKFRFPLYLASKEKSIHVKPG